MGNKLCPTRTRKRTIQELQRELNSVRNDIAKERLAISTLERTAGSNDSGPASSSPSQIALYIQSLKTNLRALEAQEVQTVIALSDLESVPMREAMQSRAKLLKKSIRKTKNGVIAEVYEGLTDDVDRLHGDVQQNTTASNEFNQALVQKTPEQEVAEAESAHLLELTTPVRLTLPNVPSSKTKAEPKADPVLVSLTKQYGINA
jgi:hypothetical protein